MFSRVSAVFLTLTMLVTACADGGEVPSSPSAQSTLVARANGASIAVFESPGAPDPKLRLRSPNEYGAPAVFLVKKRQPDWLEVLLPIRPNGSRGWIRQSDVSLASHPFRIKVELGAHRITVWNENKVFLQEPVGVGRADAPTPGGEYFLTVLLRPPDPNGPYGHYAFGLSGYSEVYKSFAGGPGALGLHGTNDPSGLGKDVSAGCIRMSNEGITKLAAVLPLGTPLEIVA